MSLYAVSDTRLTAIADAIREKDGLGTATVDEMPERIRSITTGGRVQLSNNDVQGGQGAIAFTCPFDPTNVFFSVNSSYTPRTHASGQYTVIGGSVGVHMGTPFAERLLTVGVSSSQSYNCNLRPEAYAITKTYANGVCTLQVDTYATTIAGLGKYSIVAWE